MAERDDRRARGDDRIKALVDTFVSGQSEQRTAMERVTGLLSPCDIAELIIGARRVRNRFFEAHLFGEPAWDILLEIYVAYHQDRISDVRSIATCGGTSLSAGMRWVSALKRAGLIAVDDETADPSRQTVTLTEAGLSKMDDYVAAYGSWMMKRSRSTMGQ